MATMEFPIFHGMWNAMQQQQQLTIMGKEVPALSNSIPAHRWTQITYGIQR